MKNSRLLLGDAGTGKSITMRALFTKDIRSNYKRILIIDGENEYSEVVDKYSGEQLEIDDLSDEKNEKVFLLNTNYLFNVVDAENRDEEATNLLTKISNFIETNKIDTVYMDSGILLRKLLKDVREYPNFRKVDFTASATYLDHEKELKINYQLLFKQYYVFKNTRANLKSTNLLSDFVKENAYKLERGLFYDAQGDLRETIIVDLENHRYGIL